MPKPTGQARMQLQIINGKTLNSMVFEDQPHIPRVGETVSVYDVDNDGAILFTGTVTKVEWAYTNENDDSTCSVFLE